MRDTSTYRAFRRNQALRVEKGVWFGVVPKGTLRRRFRLNRSKHLDGKPTHSPYN